MSPFRVALNDKQCDLAGLAKDLKIHRGTVWRWRTGKTVPVQPLAGQVIDWLRARGYDVDFNSLYQASPDSLDHAFGDGCGEN